MSHFLVYIPETPESRATVFDEIARVGLSDLADGASNAGGIKGPDGKTGLLVGWPKPTDGMMHYSEEEQEWFPCKPDGELPAERYWIGVWVHSLPKPKDLQRVYPYPGINVTLGDGNSWHIPKIKELPSDAIRADDGSWKFVVQQQYHGIYIESAEWQDVVQQNREFDLGSCIDYLHRCLQLNYRLPPDLCEYLKLLNTKVLLQCLGASLGIDVESAS